MNTRPVGFVLIFNILTKGKETKHRREANSNMFNSSFLKLLDLNSIVYYYRQNRINTVRPVLCKQKCYFHRKGEWDVTGIFAGMLDFIL